MGNCKLPNTIIGNRLALRFRIHERLRKVGMKLMSICLR